MTDDPDEVRYVQEVAKRDPSTAIEAVEAIEDHLRYGIPALKRIGWAIVILLALVLWRLW